MYIDIAAYREINANPDNVILSTIGGDASQYSLFALGITPAVWGMMLSAIISAIRSKSTKARISPKTQEKERYIAAFILAALLSVVRSGQLMLTQEAVSHSHVIAGNAILMIIGAVVVMGLCNLNKEHGFGGQTILIVLNIIETIFRTVYGASFDDLKLPLLLIAIVVAVEIVMDNVEMRIPLMRVSIHNVNAEKNYLPLRLNPAGLMPVIFASIVFLIPQSVLMGLYTVFPENAWIQYIYTHMVTTSPLGFVVFIVIIYILTFMFSYLFLRPDELVENFQKTGDCIEGVRAGRETRRFLYTRLYAMCLISATIMSVCVGIPMYFRATAGQTAGYFALPMTCMILSSMMGSLIREMKSTRSFGLYRSFL